MFKEVEPKILTSKFFDRNTFEIKMIPSSLILSQELQHQVDSNWKNFVTESNKKGSKLWDGIYYRLENIDAVKNDSQILSFSTIPYSVIRGLTFRRDLSKLKKQFRPNHIATAALIHTSDNYFVFGERNKKTLSNYSIDLIGGGLQPDELEIKICSDIFDNQLKEINEELGVENQHVISLNGIGIVLSSRYNVIFIFYAELNLTKNQIEKFFKENNDEEMEGIVFVKEEKLEEFLSDKGSYRPLVSKLYEVNKFSKLI